VEVATDAELARIRNSANVLGDRGFNQPAPVKRDVSIWGFSFPMRAYDDRGNLLGEVISGFGVRSLQRVVRSPLGGPESESELRSKVMRNFHRGLDIAGPVGTPVFAATEGRILKVVSGCRNHSGENTGPEVRKCGDGLGNHVVIIHEATGFESIYAHLTANCRFRNDGGKNLSIYERIKVGRTVQRGEKIGCVGMSGETYGPHLHFEIRNAGYYLDPAEMLGHLFDEFPQSRLRQKKVARAQSTPDMSP
jgi:murein DD-endopeptidase MepM/ murein hydrolase activator NlpD